MSDQFSLKEFYDAYPRIEEEFQAALDVSLNPRGPEMLYDMVEDLHLPSGATAIDVGCGEGKQALKLAERFELAVSGFDPVSRHIELANEGLAAAVEQHPDLKNRVRFELGTAEALPVDNASVDFVWCKDVLVHVAALETAYAEFERVLRSGGRVLVFQSLFAIEPLDPQEATRMYKTNGVVATSTDPALTDAAITAAGLQTDECIDVGIELGEWAEEHSGKVSRQLLHLSRLLRAPERYVAKFGQQAYDIMLEDCLWHVDHMTGRRRARVYLLSRR